VREWDVEGVWDGQFLRDGAAPGEGVPFTLTLKEGWFGRFRGTVREDPARGGVPEEGRIRGRVKGFNLRFVKWMPVLYMPDGTTASRYILETQGVDVQHEIGHPPVIYEGRYDPENDRARGAWLFGPYKIFIWIDGVSVRHEVERATGTWEIRRSKAWPIGPSDGVTHAFPPQR